VQEYIKTYEGMREELDNLDNIFWLLLKKL